MSNDMERDIRELKQAVEGNSAALRAAIEGLKATNADLNAATADLNAATAGLKATNAKLDATNADVARMNGELHTTNSRLKRTMVSVAGLAGGMSDLKLYLAENMATKKDMSDLNARMDGFSGLLLDSRHRWAVHAETLSEHDARLKKLETPSA